MPCQTRIVKSFRGRILGVQAVKIINNFKAQCIQHQRHCFKHAAMVQQDRRMLKGNQHNQVMGQPIIGTVANAERRASEVGCGDIWADR